MANTSWVDKAVNKGVSEWKPPFLDTFAGVAKNYPISSVVSLGAVPLAGSLAGKLGNAASALVAPDNRSLSQRVQDNVSPAMRNITDAGQSLTALPPKPSVPSVTPLITPKTIASHVPGSRVAVTANNPAPIAAVGTGRPRPKKTATTGTIAGITGDAYMPGALDGGQQQTASAPRVTEMTTEEFTRQNGGIADYEPPAGGGVAIQGDRALVLRGRTAQEEQAQPMQTAVASIAAPSAPQLTTYGDSTGVYQLAPGQNPPPDYSKMSFGELVNANRRQKDERRGADIANIGSEITHRGNQDSIAALELPSKIGENTARARNLDTSSDIAGFKAPAEVKKIEADTAHLDALTKETDTLREARKLGLISDARYKTGILKATNKKIDLLIKESDERLKNSKKSNTMPDFKLMAETATDLIKYYGEIEAMGQIAPEQKLARDKQLKNLEIIQRNATKPVTQFGTGNLAMDDV